MKTKPFTAQFIQSPTAQYEVGERLGQTESFTLYECILEDCKPGILKIAREKTHNGKLDLEAFVLQTLQDGVERIDPENTFQYDKSFPFLLESFISKEQGDRNVLILDLSRVAKSLSDLVPLGHLSAREKIRVDPKTSVWIMGKQLKLLDFACNIGVSVQFSGDNVLINRDNHRVVVFDWSNSIVSNMVLEPKRVSEQIARAAQLTITALGGDLKTGKLPADDQYGGSDVYEKLLMKFTKGVESDAGKAHTQFYTTVLELWPSGFHNFTAYSILP
ncbi:MAG: hypothetical protein WC087_00900 [Candidatus Paceibacterota bacterium]